jgi:hypothetical protein
LIEIVIPLSSLALELLSTVDETQEKMESWNARKQKQQEKSLEFDDERMYLEDLPCRASMDPQGLVQRVVERDYMVSKLWP